ncbi:protein FAM210B, mitochondrial isoform X2 [Rousettus aegyptiacus]|uniref:protein FAM210B, mitochondrial isoform X2 n=2 Tax=Rousettus aegyptiacus TaxID=9407 RepID=UPI00168CFB0A|nr:protein FAM210B, mitochondrial isoform X2 [Rousettus aegyptiacus]
MARLLVLLGPAGRVGARVQPRATWLLSATAPCAPPPSFLPLLRPGPDSRLLSTARGDGSGRQDPSKIPAVAGSDVGSPQEKKQSKSQQLKKIFQEYGAVGVVLHIGISLVSLGIFYAVVSSGVDMSAILLKLGLTESLVQSKVAAGTSTFVVAYALHKLFAPVRISITLLSVPLIVRRCTAKRSRTKHHDVCNLFLKAHQKSRPAHKAKCQLSNVGTGGPGL